MRMMMKVTIPVAAGNQAIKDGSLPRIVKQTLETLKPEAAYFVTDHGKRTTLLFFDLKDPSQIPAICEPLFEGMHAEVELTPAMNVQDLQAGLSQLKG